MNLDKQHPAWDRFLNADALIGRTGDLLGHNMFAYCQNNPVTYYDPNGNVIETVIDVFSIGWSFCDLFKDPSLANLGFLLWDIVAAPIPFIPGSYVYKGGKLIFKIASKADELAKGIGITLDTYKKLQKLFKGVKGIEIHHLIEKRFAKRIGVNANDILSIPLANYINSLLMHGVKSYDMVKITHEMKLLMQQKKYMKIFLNY